VKTWLIILSIAVILIGLVVYLTTRPPSRSSDYEIDDVIAMPHSGTEERERTVTVDMYSKDAGPVDIEVMFISNGEQVAAGEITWTCPEPGDWEVAVPIELTPGFTWYVTYNEYISMASWFILNNNQISNSVLLPFVKSRCIPSHPKQFNDKLMPP